MWQSYASPVYLHRKYIHPLSTHSIVQIFPSFLIQRKSMLYRCGGGEMWGELEYWFLTSTFLLSWKFMKITKHKNYQYGQESREMKGRGKYFLLCYYKNPKLFRCLFPYNNLYYNLVVSLDILVMYIINDS